MNQWNNFPSDGFDGFSEMTVLQSPGHRRPFNLQQTPPPPSKTSLQRKESRKASLLNLSKLSWCKSKQTAVAEGIEPDRERDHFDWFL
jgi:hypothetical protein